MTSTAVSPKDYLASLPDDRKDAVQTLRDTIAKNLPEGFEEVMQYGLPGFVVPHSTYPAGYHCNPKQALPFAGYASQKNFIALYHMGLYCMPELMDWFANEHSKRSKTKLDMGKSCIRFKKPEKIPYDLIGELMRKVTPDEWIAVYESRLKK